MSLTVKHVHVSMTSKDYLVLIIGHLDKATVNLEEIAFRKSDIRVIKSTCAFSFSLVCVNLLTVVITGPTTEQQNLFGLRDLESTDV